jgi:hypothetical protein
LRGAFFTTTPAPAVSAGEQSYKKANTVVFINFKKLLCDCFGILRIPRNAENWLIPYKSFAKSAGGDRRDAAI